MSEMLVFLLFSGTGQLPVISEVMSNPTDETTGEYVEIFNPSPSPSSLLGFSLTDGDALDELLAWDETIHGPFPHAEAVIGTDTIPPYGFAVVFELDYPTGPLLTVADGTVILTTGDHSICNGLAASSDPLTLFSSEGTSSVDVQSTYGTPVDSDDWHERDDDGLDAIPFDPGDGFSIERYPLLTPDCEEFWQAGAEGGSPGWLPDYPDTCDVCIESFTCSPAPEPGVPFTLSAILLNCGSVTVTSVQTTLFLDDNADSIPGAAEILLTWVTGQLEPGWRDTVSTVLILEDGNFLAAALIECEDDQVEWNNLGLLGIVCGDGSFPVVSEVLCNPSDQDRDEFIELFFPGPGVFEITGCSFTDGDALDQIVQWDFSGSPLDDTNSRYGSFIPAGTFALILDSEYAEGVQPWSFEAPTLILTTNNTTLGNGLSGNDPITLYGPGGTTSSDVVSTYGTPLSSEDPLLCDDDGLDGIPYNPGTDNSVQRVDITGPDTESNWADSPEGPTPGSPPPPVTSGLDASMTSLVLSPPLGSAGSSVYVSATVLCTGTESIPAQSLEVTLYADLNGNSEPDENEIIAFQTCDELLPGDSSVVSGTWLAIGNPVDICALSSCWEDSFPENDSLDTVWNIPPGVIINEFMYYPSPGEPEWVEILNGSQTAVDLMGWTFSDSNTGVLVSGVPAELPAGAYAVVCPDTSAFISSWGNPGCLLYQPSSWPSMNNSTQQGEDYADLLFLESPDDQIVDYVPYDDDWGGGQGISLERLNPTLPGFEPSSWTGCGEGGTPGVPNSTFSGDTGAPFLFFHPDPFSPDGDGHDDTLLIEMNLRGSQNIVTLTVYNVQGREVCRLLEDMETGSLHAATWDGTNDSGESMPVGRYIIYLRAEPSVGEPHEDCAVVVLARRL